MKSGTDQNKEDLRVRLTRWWSVRNPRASNIEVADLATAPSGFSNETWFVDIRWLEEGCRQTVRLVLRREPEGASFFDDYDLQLQFDVMKALRSGGLAVPEPFDFEDDKAFLGSAFFTMEFVEGRVASGRRPGFHGHGLFFEASIEERRTMWLAAVKAMADVHSFDWRDSALGERLGSPSDSVQSIADQLHQVRGWLDQAASLGPFPVIEGALRWLDETMPRSSSTSLLWGDARPGNLIYQGTSVAAIIDWEMAGLGPGEFDLFYFLLADEVVSELNAVPRLAGLPDRIETIAAWEQAMGRPVEHGHYAEVFAATRFAALMALVVRLSPVGLDDPRAFLTDNVPTRRLQSLLENI